MGKKHKSRSGGREPKVTEHNSSDEGEFRHSDDAPDPDDISYYQDDVDKFHNHREKILLDEGAPIPTAEDSSEEEVLGLGDSSDDDETIAEYERRLRGLNVRRMKDERASDLSEQEGDEEEEDDESKAWGGRRGKFYGADFVDDRKIEFEADDVDPQVLEAQEAEAMQRKMADQLDEADFGLDIFQKSEVSETAEEKAESGERVARDVTRMSKKEKMALLQQESPEMLTLIADFKEKMAETHARLMPILERIQDGSLPPSKGADYVTAKVKLVMNYCTNISFYLALKAKRTPVTQHPVIRRLLQYRHLLQQMEPLDATMAPEIDAMLEKIRSGEPLTSAQSKEEDVVAMGTRKPDLASTYLRRKKNQEQKSEKTKKNKKKLSELISDEEDDGEEEENEKGAGKGVESTAKEGKAMRKRAREEGRYMTEEERHALEFYTIMKSGKRSKPQDGEEEPVPSKKRVSGDVASAGMDEDGGDMSDEEGEGKRAITYEMATNKGLAPKRKKEQRNPRVKNKLKYKKAVKRRRGMVREVRTEMTPYGGELSGIRAGVKKSTKFRS